MSWSKNGSENIAKVITTYASESCKDITKHLNIQLLPKKLYRICWTIYKWNWTEYKRNEKAKNKNKENIYV